MQPPRDNHQVGKTQHSSCFHMSVVSRSWEACASFNLTRLSATLPVCLPYRPEVVAPCGAARPDRYARQDRTDDAHL